MNPAGQITELEARLCEVARLHRLGLRAQAAQGLAAVTEELERFLLGGRGAQSCAPVLLEILCAQERGDLIGIADLLEFDLPAYLQ